MDSVFPHLTLTAGFYNFSIWHLHVLHVSLIPSPDTHQKSL
jgi:hypothetical protein